MVNSNVDSKKYVSQVVRRFSSPKSAYKTLLDLASKLDSEHELSAVVEVSRQYGIDDIDMLRLFERLFDRYPKRNLTDLSKSLRNKIEHYQDVNGVVPPLSRIEKFLLDFESNERSGNYGKEAPGVARRRGEMEMESYRESRDYEP